MKKTITVSFLGKDWVIPDDLKAKMPKLTPEEKKEVLAFLDGIIAKQRSHGFVPRSLYHYRHSIESGVHPVDVVNSVTGFSVRENIENEKPLTFRDRLLMFWAQYYRDNPWRRWRHWQRWFRRIKRCEWRRKPLIEEPVDLKGALEKLARIE